MGLRKSYGAAGGTNVLLFLRRRRRDLCWPTNLDY